MMPYFIIKSRIKSYENNLSLIVSDLLKINTKYIQNFFSNNKQKIKFVKKDL